MMFPKVTNFRSFFAGLLLSSLLVVVVGCRSTSVMPTVSTTSRIDRVFFAQKHVLEPSAPTFGLIGDLEALIKVQVYSDLPARAPEAFAVLTLDDKTKDLPLRGPTILPKKPVVEPAMLKHSFDDSFTAIIPREWVRPGLTVAVELRRYDYRSTPDAPVNVLDRKVFDDLKVGAPNKMILTMFTVHYFGLGKGENYPDGWRNELEAKLPVSEIELRRVPSASFDTIVMPPIFGKPSTISSSPEDFEKQTGKKYDGEQGIALKWNSALKRAGGLHGNASHYFLNISGVHSGGQAGGFRGVGNLARPGVLIHELGHTFGLPHWQGRKTYPYKGHMCGVPTVRDDFPHVGPNWAFDLNRRAFITPIVQQTNDRGVKGQWKKDPMAGGGFGDQEDGFIFRHFSDYSMMRMRSFMEHRAVVWNKDLNAFASWDPNKQGYAKPVPVRGPDLKVERDVEVISLLFTANVVTTEANIVYPPIGPYVAGLPERFDADSAEARKRAIGLKAVREDGNVCIRVTQGGVTKTYLTWLRVDQDDDPMKSFHVAAINLPAKDGQITKAELLHVPDLMKTGVKGKVKVLHLWSPSGN